MTTLILSPGLHDQLAREACATFPRECCGLIEGGACGARIEIVALHPAHNIAAAVDRFEIDPSDQFRILRGARERGRAIIGCYHSHPGGKAAPSQCDRDGASEAGFVWLIAAATARDLAGVAAYMFDGKGFLPLTLLPAASLDPVLAPRV